MWFNDAMVDDSVSLPEQIGYALLCVLTAAAPMVAFVSLHAVPGVPPGRWYDSGVFVSWAFLIYFSWACLPGLDQPPQKRRREWALFVSLELAYPVLSGLLEGDSRLFLLADVFSVFSTSVAGAASLLLVYKGAQLVRAGDAMVLPVLLVVGYVMAWPGLVVEWYWWAVVELPRADALSQALRAAGVVAGTTAVMRNLWNSPLFDGD